MSAITDRNSILAAHAKWSPVASSFPDGPLSVPVQVVLGEGVDIAMLFNTHWNPTRKKQGANLPGFSGVAPQSDINENTGSDIYELVAAAGHANAVYHKMLGSSEASPMERAEFVLYEIKATLEFVFDDDEHTTADDQLEQLANQFSRPTSQDGMAVALEAYVELASEYRDKLTGLDSFDLKMLDEALVLAGALRMRSGEALIGETPSGMRQLLLDRNRLVALLQERTGRVRRAARYVFRAFPDVAKQFSSAYERNRRRDQRRRKTTEPEVPTDVATPAAPTESTAPAAPTATETAAQ